MSTTPWCRIDGLLPGCCGRARWTSLTQAVSAAARAEGVARLLDATFEDPFDSDRHWIKVIMTAPTFAQAIAMAYDPAHVRALSSLPVDVVPRLAQSPAACRKLT